MGERDPGPRQLGGDAERLGPSRGKTTPEDGVRRRCIYPGCERPAVPAAPGRRPAAGVL